MQDPRALANSKNLNSYRSWERDGYRRSGFGAIFMCVSLLVVVFTVATTLFEHAAKDARALAVLAGAAFAVYLVATGGLMLFGVLRLNAWKRAHPWTPPPSGRAYPAGRILAAGLPESRRQLAGDQTT